MATKVQVAASRSRGAKKRIQIDPKETEAFLNRPVKKLEDLNRSLKKSYEKGFFNKPQFSHFQILKSKRANKDNDSIQSDQNQDDQDFILEQPKLNNNRRRGRRRGSSDSDQDDHRTRTINKTFPAIKSYKPEIKQRQPLQNNKNNKKKQSEEESSSSSQQQSSEQKMSPLKSNLKKQQVKEQKMNQKPKQKMQSRDHQINKIKVTQQQQKIKPVLDKAVNKTIKNQQIKSKTIKHTNQSEESQSSQTDGSSQSSSSSSQQQQPPQKGNHNNQKPMAMSDNSKANILEKISNHQNKDKTNIPPKQIEKLQKSVSSSESYYKPTITQKRPQSPKPIHKQSSISRQSSYENYSEDSVRPPPLQTPKITQHKQHKTVKKCSRIYRTKPQNKSMPTVHINQHTQQKQKYTNIPLPNPENMVTQPKIVEICQQQKIAIEQPPTNMKRSYEQYISTNIKPKLSLTSKNILQSIIVTVRNPTPQPISFNQHLQQIKQQINNFYNFFQHAPCCHLYDPSQRMIRFKKIVQQPQIQQQSSQNKQHNSTKDLLLDNNQHDAKQTVYFTENQSVPPAQKKQIQVHMGLSNRRRQKATKARRNPIDIDP